MNTAVYAQRVARKRKESVRFSGVQFGIVVLVIGLLLSAFGVVYAKDLHRRLFIQYQGQQQIQEQYQVEWRKLLLEQSTWSTQSRIQLLAQRQLHMLIPSSHSIVLVEDDNETLADND